MSRDEGTLKHTTIKVEWWDHGDGDPDWGYHLRMGGIDAEEAKPVRPPRSGRLGPTLGDNIRGARLGYRWIGNLTAWVRVRPDGDNIAVDVVMNGDGFSGESKNPGSHWVWWNPMDEDLEAEIISIVIAHRNGNSPSSETLVVDDEGTILEVKR